MNRLKSLQMFFLVAIFVTTISLPLLVMVVAEERTISLTEKRTLAKRPKITFTLESITEFPPSCEAYFNDHFGLRDSLVKLYNYLFVSLFHTSPKSDIIVGKEKWLFLVSDYIISDFMGKRPLNPELILRWKQTLRDRRDWLADQGIRYLFIPSPNKITVYPEYLPRRFQGRVGKSNLHELLEHLGEKPVFTDVVNIQKPLLAAKNHSELYYNADTHWNYDGAFVAYVALVKHIKQWFPSMEPIAKKELVRVDAVFAGDLANTLNLANIYSQQTSVLRAPNITRTSSSKSFEAYKQSNKIYQKSIKCTLIENENALQDLSAVLITDSFGYRFIDFLSQNFRKIFMIRGAGFEAVTDFISAEKPDIVFDLRVARRIGDALRTNTVVRNYNVEKIASRNDLLLDISGDNLSVNLAGSHQIEVNGASKNGSFISNGTDPYLYFNFSQEKSNGSLSIYGQIESPGDTTLQLYYQTSEQPYYSEDKVFTSKVTKGGNTIYHRIYGPVLLTKIRLDPGTLPGKYAINRFVIAEEQ